MPRLSKYEYYMNIAEAVKLRSHDAETQFGGVLVKKSTGTIVATGYNGFVRGAPDSLLPNKRPDKYPYMTHCETNIICHCARYGISTEGCILYVRGTMCENCTRTMWQAGVSEAIVKEIHHSFDQVKLMKDLRVDLNYIDGTPGFMMVTVSPREIIGGIII